MHMLVHMHVHMYLLVTGTYWSHVLLYLLVTDLQSTSHGPSIVARRRMVVPVVDTHHPGLWHLVTGNHQAVYHVAE